MRVDIDELIKELTELLEEFPLDSDEKLERLEQVTKQVQQHHEDKLNEIRNSYRERAMKYEN